MTDYLYSATGRFINRKGEGRELRPLVRVPALQYLRGKNLLPCSEWIFPASKIRILLEQLPPTDICRSVQVPGLYLL